MPEVRTFGVVVGEIEVRFGRGCLELRVAFWGVMGLEFAGLGVELFDVCKGADSRLTPLHEIYFQKRALVLPVESLEWP